MRVLAGLLGLLMIVVALVLGPLSGCSTDTRAIDEAYQRGFADGLAEMQDELNSVQEAYQTGYDDGLAAAEEKHDAELCQSCYGLGFTEGYRAGLSASGNAGS